MVKFSKDLWDSFEAIAAKTDVGTAATKDLVDFLSKRAKIEADYAKSLAELCKKPSGGGLFSKGDPLEKEAKTIKAVIVSLREEGAHTATSHQEFSAKIVTDVVKPLEGFLKSKDNERKKSIQEGQKRLKAQADAKNAHDRAKESYTKAGKESDAASEAHEKAQKDLFADPENKKLKENEKKAATKVQPAGDKLKAAEGAYQKAVDSVNDVQAKTFTEYLPPILDFLQQYEEDRFAVLRQVLGDFLRHQKSVPDQINGFALEIAKQIDSLDLGGDLDEFVTANAKDKSEPVAYTFANYKEEASGSSSGSGSSGPSTTYSVPVIPKKDEPAKEKEKEKEKGKDPEPEPEAEVVVETETKKEDELFES